MDIRQHRNQEERCRAARRLKLSPCLLSAPVVADSVQNEANLAFGSLPLRLYVLQGGRVAYEGGMGPVFYRMPEVERWLSRWKTSVRRSSWDSHSLTTVEEIDR